MCNMKKLLFFGATLLLMFVSCSKDDDVPEVPVEPVRYYVKYEVTFNTQHINAPRHINFTNENGSQTISLTNEAKTVIWDRTYGPVDKNFVASLDCNVENYQYSSNIHAKISISRDQEPFVLKAERSGTRSVTLQYKIDF